MDEQSSPSAEEAGVTLMRRKNMMADLARGHFVDLVAPELARHRTKRFDSGEHAVIPTAVLKIFGYGGPDRPDKYPAASYQIPLPNGLTLTYGQLVALSGDFYADYRRPISNQLPGEREVVALAAYELLCSDRSRDEANNILAIMNDEIAMVRDGELCGLSSSIAYRWAGDRFDRKYNGATGGAEHGGVLPWYATPGRYLELASTNMDHFGADAWIAYATFHRMAMRGARFARSVADLNKAYALNAFGDHYLTDLFASGHIRTPRRQLYAKAVGAQVAAGPELPELSVFGDVKYAGGCSKQMHDEDNHNGLWVKNDLGDTWIAYGDNRYRDIENYANVVIAQKVVARSIDDLWVATQSKDDIEQIIEISLAAIQKYLPRVIGQGGGAAPTTKQSYSSLYVVDEAKGLLMRRSKVGDLLDYTWRADFALEDSYDEYKGARLREGASLFGACGQTGAIGLPPDNGASTIAGPELLQDGRPLPVPTTPLGSAVLMGLAPAPFSVATAGGGDVELGYITEDAALAYVNGKYGASGWSWSEWAESIEGLLMSSPAAAWFDGHYHALFMSELAFGPEPEGIVYDAVLVPTGMKRTAVASGWFLSAPCVITNAKQMISFACRNDGKVVTNSYISPSGRWTATSPIGSGSAPRFIGTPSAAFSGNNLFVCATDETGQFYWTGNSSGTWSAWTAVTEPDRKEEPQCSRAALAGWGGDVMYFFALTWRKGDEGRVWYRRMQGGAEKPEGGIIGTRRFLTPPTAVYVADEHLEIFAVGLDNKVYRASYVNKSWPADGTEWTALPDIVAVSPVVAVKLSAADAKQPQVMVTVRDRQLQLSTLVMTFSAPKTSDCTFSPWTPAGTRPPA